MESVIGIIIWVIVLIVIISRTIRQVPTSSKKGKEEEKKREDLARLFETIFTGQPQEEIEVPEEIKSEETEVEGITAVEAKLPEPVAVEAETIQKAEPVEEPQKVTREIKRTPLPKDLRQAIILQEIFGPPKSGVRP